MISGTPGPSQAGEAEADAKEIGGDPGPGLQRPRRRDTNFPAFRLAIVSVLGRGICAGDGLGLGFEENGHVGHGDDSPFGARR